MIRRLSPCKVNLSLDVLRRRPDGFHDLRTIYQAIDLCDELAVAPARGHRDTLRLEGPYTAGVPQDSANLVLHALEVFRARVGVPVAPLDIVLTKNVPPGSGLGGGSSNAANVLAAANVLLGLGISATLLEETAAVIGSDCAYFVRAGTQEAEERGEVLMPLERRRDFHLLLALPAVHVATPPAYRALDPATFGERTDWRSLRAWLAGDEQAPLPRLHNTFEQSVAARFPEVARVLAALRTLAPDTTLLSGSGSACFALFRTRAEADAARAAWPLADVPVRVCRPLQSGSVGA